MILGTFSDQVDKLYQFYLWDEQEACRQAQDYLRGTALAYVRCAPFQPQTWEELKALLIQRFQPWNPMVTNKDQFRY